MHDKKPKPAQVDAEVRGRAERLLSAEYTEHVRKLLPAVLQRRVRSTIAGNSGFVLRLDGSQWVAAFLENARLEYATGAEPPSAAVVGRLNSPNYGDPRVPLPVDLPYASEQCDIAAEIAKSVGSIITGLAYGESCFNFCFPGGMELDATISTDAQGRSTLRVFWEQW